MADDGGPRRGRLPIFRGGPGFAVWQKSMTYSLRSAKCWPVVSGELKVTNQAGTDSDTDAKDDFDTATYLFQDFQDLEDKAMEMIYNSLSDNIKAIMCDHITSKDLWDALDKKFGRRTRADVGRLIRGFLDRKKSKTESMESYLSSIRTLFTTAMTARPKLTFEDLFIIAVCTGVPAEYSSTTIAILNDETATIDTVEELLLSAESTMAANGTVAGVSPAVEPATVNALQASSAKPRPKCTHCGRAHNVETCYQLHPELRPKTKETAAVAGATTQAPSSSAPSSGGVQPSSDDPFAHLLQNMERALVARVHTSDSPPSEFLSINIENALSANVGPNQLDILIDSGASRHMFTDRSIFLDLRSSVSVIRTCEDNRTLKPEGIGTVGLFVNGKPCILKDVLLVPSLGGNLFSLSRLQLQGGTYSPEGLKAMSLTLGEATFTATIEEDGLYHLRASRLHATSMMYHAMSAKTTTDWYKWHRLFGHVSHNILKATLVHYAIPHTPEDLHCSACIKGKMSRTPFSPRPTDSKATSPLERVHSDVAGPLRIPSIGGARYFLTLLDDYSNYCWVIPMVDKAHVPSALILWVRQVESLVGNHKVRFLRTDNGGEFVNAELNAFVDGRGIIRETTAPHQPEQNGKAERLNRTLMDTVRTWLSCHQLPPRLWGELVVTAAKLKNIVWSHVSNGIPRELLLGKSADLSYLRPVGPCYVHLNLPGISKLAPRGYDGTLIGYEDDRTFRVLVNGKIIKTRNVRSKEPFPSATSPAGPAIDYQLVDLTDDPVEGNDYYSDGEVSPARSRVLPQDPVTPSATFTPSATPTPIPSNPQAEISLIEDQSGDEDSLPTGRPHRETRLPARYASLAIHSDYEDRHEEPQIIGLDTALLTLVKDSQEPSTYDQAVNGSDRSKWLSAISSELDSLAKNGTWSPVSLPPGRRAITSKWVFKVKRDSTNEIVKYKARLVVRGFSQVKGVDYHETFAPVSSISTFRILIAMCISKGLHLRHLDIETAFLYGACEEEIYMVPPPGVSIPSGKVLRLHKSLYGLKQAPRVWHQCLSTALKGLGFEESQADTCLLERTKKGTPYLILMFYVDDICVGGKSDQAIDDLIDQLRLKFVTKDLGPLSWYLGLKVEYDLSTGIAKLSQSSYIAALLERFNLEYVRKVDTPMVSSRDATSPSPPAPPDTPYAQAIGGILYAALATRPDVCLAVGLLAKETHHPTKRDWRAVQRVLLYLGSTPNVGVTYRADIGIKTGLRFSGYCDADHAGQPDRKSISGVIYLLAGGPVVWSSKSQSKVALSPQEAELNAALTAARDGVWLCQFYSLLMYSTNVANTIVIRTDSTGALSYMKGMGNRGRGKHYDLELKWLQQLTGSPISFAWVSTEHQLADFLTKPLANTVFHRLLQLSGVE